MKLDLDNETLLQHWRNANVTYGQCIGHGKAAHNKDLIDIYESEMKKRNTSIPEERYDGGKFNGPGSF